MRFLFWLFILSSILISRCGLSPGKHETYFVPIDETGFAQAAIDSGTMMNIIAFSGGKESDNDHTYYEQFIVTTPGNGDTLRVLAPVIRVGPERIFTTPLQFNYEKGMHNAFFMPEDSSLHLAINTMAMKDISIENIGNFDKLSRQSTARKMIVMVKGIPLFESDRYKTTTGILYFEQQPW